MRPVPHQRRVREHYQNLGADYRQQEQQESEIQSEDTRLGRQGPESVVLPALPNGGGQDSDVPARAVLQASLGLQEYAPQRSSTDDEVSTMNTLKLQVKRMEKSMAVQSRALADLTQELQHLKGERDIEVQQDQPTVKAVYEVVARQETDRERLHQIGSLVRVLNNRIEMLERQADGVVERGERRLSSIESRLNGVTDVRRLVVAQMHAAEDLASTDSAVKSHGSTLERLKSELNRAARNADAGNMTARTVRDDVARISGELRQVLSSEAAAARAAVAQEAAARQDLTLAIERQQREAARAVDKRNEVTTSVINERFDHVEIAIDDERKVRAAAVDRALDEIKQRWEAEGKLRASDKEARRNETDALRTALRLMLTDTERRVDSIHAAVEAYRNDVMRATQDKFADQGSEMQRIHEFMGGKISEVENILSAEILARRMGAAKFAARIDEAEEQCRNEVLTATNRLIEVMVKLENKSKGHFDTCDEKLQVVSKAIDKVRREALDFTVSSTNQLRAVLEASVAAILAKLAGLEVVAKADRDANLARCFSLKEEMAGNSRETATHMSDLRIELGRLCRQLRADAFAAVNSVASDLSCYVDKTSAARAALDAQYRADQERARDATHNYTRSACNKVALGLRQELAEREKSLALRIADAHEGLSAQSVASRAEHFAESQRHALLRADIASLEHGLRENCTKGCEAVADTARRLLDLEVRERQKANASTTTALRQAIADMDASLRTAVEECDSSVQRQLSNLRESLSGMVAAEGRATRAAARALIETERVERTNADVRSSDATLRLVESTKASVEAAAAALFDEACMKAKRHRHAEAEQRVALAHALRHETNVQLQAVEERNIVSRVLQSAIDLVADADTESAKRRLAREINCVKDMSTCRAANVSKAVEAEISTRIQSDADIRARIASSAALNAMIHEISEAHDRNRQECLVKAIDDVRAGAKQYADEIKGALGMECANRADKETQFEMALKSESQSRKADDMDLATKIVDEVYAREQEVIDLTTRLEVVSSMGKMVDLVADGEVRLELTRNFRVAEQRLHRLQTLFNKDAANDRSAAQRHISDLSNRIDDVTVGLTLEEARVSKHIASCAARDAHARSALTAQSWSATEAMAVLSSDFQSVLEHEVESRLHATKTNREDIESQIGECNKDIAEAERRLQDHLNSLETDTKSSYDELKAQVEALRRHTASDAHVSAHMEQEGLPVGDGTADTLEDTSRAPAPFPARSNL